jgi:hypothetical protein
MVKRVNQTQIQLHNNNYNTDSYPCQVYNCPLVTTYRILDANI